MTTVLIVRSKVNGLLEARLFILRRRAALRSPDLSFRLNWGSVVLHVGIPMP